MPPRARAAAAVVLLALAGTSCAAWKQFAYDLDRDEWQQPDAVIALLGIRPGDIVVDLGDGYFTFRLAEAVGESGLVYALDADDDVYHYLKRQIRRRTVENVVLREKGAHVFYELDGEVVTGHLRPFFRCPTAVV